MGYEGPHEASIRWRMKEILSIFVLVFVVIPSEFCLVEILTIYFVVSDDAKWKLFD